MIKHIQATVTNAGSGSSRKKFIIGIIFFILAVVGTSKVEAQPYGKKSIKQVQINQQNRIYTGIVDGSLTPKEAARLEYQQARIHHQIKTARRCGYMGPYERLYIRGEQARASKDIYRLKHNGLYR